MWSSNTLTPFSVAEVLFFDAHRGGIDTRVFLVKSSKMMDIAPFRDWSIFRNYRYFPSYVF